MEDYPVYIFKIHKKNKGRLNCWINQHRLNFSPANSLSSKEKKKKGKKRIKEKRKEKKKKPSEQVRMKYDRSVKWKLQKTTDL